MGWKRSQKHPEQNLVQATLRNWIFVTFLLQTIQYVTQMKAFGLWSDAAWGASYCSTLSSGTLLRALL